MVLVTISNVADSVIVECPVFIVIVGDVVVSVLVVCPPTVFVGDVVVSVLVVCPPTVGGAAVAPFFELEVLELEFAMLRLTVKDSKN